MSYKNNFFRIKGSILALGASLMITIGASAQCFEDKIYSLQNIDNQWSSTGSTGFIGGSDKLLVSEGATITSPSHDLSCYNTVNIKFTYYTTGFGNNADDQVIITMSRNQGAQVETKVVPLSSSTKTITRNFDVNGSGDVTFRIEYKDVQGDNIGASATLVIYDHDGDNKDLRLLTWASSMRAAKVTFDNSDISVTGDYSMSASLNGSLDYYTSNSKDGGHYARFKSDRLDLGTGVLSGNTYSISFIADKDSRGTLFDIANVNEHAGYDLSWYNRIRLYVVDTDLKIQKTDESVGRTDYDKVSHLSSGGGPYHIVFCRDKDEISVYVDGNLEYHRTSMLRYTANKSPNYFVFGTKMKQKLDNDQHPYVDYEDKFKGKIDEIYVAKNTYLGSADVSKLYNRFKNRDYLDDFYDNETSRLLTEELDTPDELQVSLFPNPSDGNGVNFYFNASDFGSDAQMNIYDLSGALIESQVLPASQFGDKLFNVNFSNQLMGGIYSLQIKQGSESQFHRLVVER